MIDFNDDLIFPLAKVRGFYLLLSISNLKALGIFYTTT
ncbi:hypothetical protein AO368_0822 [Moraxella catarrhalis]|nr:hypothetical protein AO368_0822 [Moraxella catarrhalis]